VTSLATTSAPQTLQFVAVLLERVRGAHTIVLALDHGQVVVT